MHDDSFELWDLRIEVVVGERPTVCGRQNGDHFTVSGEEMSHVADYLMGTDSCDEPDFLSRRRDVLIL